MPKYLAHASYTVEGLKGLLKDGGTKRREVIEQLAKHWKLSTMLLVMTMFSPYWISRTMLALWPYLWQSTRPEEQR